MRFVTWKTRETQRKSIQTPFLPPGNPHGVTETRTRDLTGVKRASNRLHHGAAFTDNRKVNIVAKVSEIILIMMVIIIIITIMITIIIIIIVIIVINIKSTTL